MARSCGSPMARMASSSALNTLACRADGCEVVAERVEPGGLAGDGVAHLLGQLAGLLAGATTTGRHRTTSSGAPLCAVREASDGAAVRSACAKLSALLGTRHCRAGRHEEHR